MKMGGVWLYEDGCDCMKMGVAIHLNCCVSFSEVDVTATRCTLTSISLGGSALFLLILSIVRVSGHSTFTFSLVIMTIVNAFHGLSVGGSLLNPLDLAPSQAGLLFSAMETTGALAGE
jgi:hypothetical protein